MAFIAAASIIGLATATSAGLGYAGAQSQASAAREGAGMMADAQRYASFLQGESLAQVRQLLGQFTQLGTAAGSTLQNLMVSPEERKRQLDLQRSDLQAEVDRLSVPIPDSAVAPPGGKNSSERWAMMLNQLRGDRAQQLAEAKAKLTSFDNKAQIELSQATDRQKEGAIQESPLYKFQEQIGTRNINRELAARGLYNSGAGLETIRNFQEQLGAGEADRQFNRLFGILGIGANAANAEAGAVSGTAQNIANQTLQGAAGQAQFDQQAAAAGAQGLNAISGAIQGGVNNGAQLYMYNNLIDRLPALNAGNAPSLYDLSGKVNTIVNGASPGGNAFGLPSNLGPQLQTGVQPFVPQTFSITGGG